MLYIEQYKPSDRSRLGLFRSVPNFSKHTASRTGSLAHTMLHSIRWENYWYSCLIKSACFSLLGLIRQAKSLGLLRISKENRNEKVCFDMSRRIQQQWSEVTYLLKPVTNSSGGISSLSALLTGSIEMRGRKSKTARQLARTSHSASSTKNRPGQILEAQTSP